jgi:hypothetical protein
MLGAVSAKADEANIVNVNAVSILAVARIFSLLNLCGCMRNLSGSAEMGITRTGEIGFSRSGYSEPGYEMRSSRAELPPFEGVSIRRFGSVAATAHLYLPSDGSAKFALPGAARHASE